MHRRQKKTLLYKYYERTFSWILQKTTWQWLNSSAIVSCRSDSSNNKYILTIQSNVLQKSNCCKLCISFFIEIVIKGLRRFTNTHPFEVSFFMNQKKGSFVQFFLFLSSFFWEQTIKLLYKRWCFMIHFLRIFT